MAERPYEFFLDVSVREEVKIKFDYETSPYEKKENYETAKKLK